MGGSPFSEYNQYDAVGLAELVRNGDVDAADLVEAAIEQIEDLNPRVNAVIAKHYESARRLAARGASPGPFHGVPFLVKDLAMVDGDIATFGSVFFREYRAELTSEYIERVMNAGFIPVGRTNSSEFGLLPTTEPILHGPTRNPWNTDYSAGGSSGGAACATAAGIVPMAHASDGGGSIRIPASACGVFGLKPTRGRMPRYPASAADYLSTDLAVSRSVRDTATLLDATHGEVPGGAYWAAPAAASFSEAARVDPAPLRIAVSTEDFRRDRVHPDCVAAVEATAGVLEELGHQVEVASPDVNGDLIAEAFLAVWESLAEGIFHLILEEASKRRTGRILRRSLGDWRAMKTIARLDKRASGRDAFEPFTWELADRSRRRTPAGIAAAQVELQRITHEIADFLNEFDVHLTPVLGAPPVKIRSFDQSGDWDELIEQLFSYVAFTPMANFSGMPAMSVPTHWNDDGLPVGTHFMSRAGSEEMLLSLAGQLERAMPWAKRRPPIWNDN